MTGPLKIGAGFMICCGFVAPPWAICTATARSFRAVIRALADRTRRCAIDRADFCCRHGTADPARTGGMVPVCARVAPGVSIGASNSDQQSVAGTRTANKIDPQSAWARKSSTRTKKIAPTAAGAKVHIAVPLTSAKNFSAPSLLNVPDS
jgi:hypothetical protein